MTYPKRTVSILNTVRRAGDNFFVISADNRPVFKTNYRPAAVLMAAALNSQASREMYDTKTAPTWRA